MERTTPKSRAEAKLRKVKIYNGNECKTHHGAFIRYTSNGVCVLCASGYDSRKRGYVPKKADGLAFTHPVSPWPRITAEQAARIDLTPGRGNPCA